MTGPVAAVATHFTLNMVQPIMSVPVQEVEDRVETPGLVCSIMLTIIYTSIYTVSMVVCETNEMILSNPYLLIMIKYVFGTCHHSLVPLIIIITRPDIRDLIKVTINMIINYSYFINI